MNGLDDVGAWTNRKATTQREISARVLMLGGSAVGVELEQFLRRFGAEVTVVQVAPRLPGREDPRLGELTAGYLRDDGARCVPRSRLPARDATPGRR